MIDGKNIVIVKNKEGNCLFLVYKIEEEDEEEISDNDWIHLISKFLFIKLSFIHFY